MRIAVVVQRYGEEIAGGAELHARYVAELLAPRHDVVVLTTTARDYLTWESAWPAGESRVAGVRVVRFPVDQAREQQTFARAQARAFVNPHSRDDERAYLMAQGPMAPELWRHLAAGPGRYDARICFSYRYITSWEAAMSLPARTLLVPTAESDPVVDFELSRELFRSVGAIAYNSEEEQQLLHASAANQAVPGEIVGIGSRIPAAPDGERFRRNHAVASPYLLYVGRIDRNKGCAELFRYFTSYIAETQQPLELLLIGSAVMEIPRHPAIRHLGFLSDADKFDALAGARVLMMPSPYESLSMVTLEAMALGIPPLVNGHCEVLRGQVRRANAGLYYEGYEEFFEALRLLVATPRLGQIMGNNGRAYYASRYTDSIICEKYERLLAGLAS